MTHGEANYQFLTAVFKTYRKLNPDGILQEVNLFLAELLGCREEQVYTELEHLLDQMIARKKLREYGMKPEEIRSFAESVKESQQRLLDQSYVKFDAGQMEEIYRSLY